MPTTNLEKIYEKERTKNRKGKLAVCRLIFISWLGMGHSLDFINHPLLSLAIDDQFVVQAKL